MASSWLRLAHRTAIVTGAGSGIGESVARSLVAEGCHVLLADAGGKSVEGVANDIVNGNKRGIDADGDDAAAISLDKAVGRGICIGCAEPVVCDVTDADQVQQLIVDADALATSALEASSPTTCAPTSVTGFSLISPPLASILVNCAGITRDSLLPNMSVDDFDSVIDVNLKGTWLTCKYFCAEDRLASLQAHYQNIVKDNESSESELTIRASDGGASIINIGSVVSRTGNVGQTNYGASKGGVVGLTRSLAKEMARHGVRANVILPGFIDTPMAQAVPQRIRDGIQRKIPLGSFGRPQDIANLALFLASSERSGYITGETIECSGQIAL